MEGIHERSLHDLTTGQEIQSPDKYGHSRGSMVVLMSRADVPMHAGPLYHFHTARTTLTEPL